MIGDLITQPRYGQGTASSPASAAMAFKVPDRLPHNLALAARRAIRDVELQEDDYFDALLRALVSASWPSSRAQDQ
jgi:hypothetical protein